MTELTEPLWNGLGNAGWEELYQPLVKLLYDVGFIGIREHGERPQYSYASPSYVDLPSHLHAAARFVIHPAFRAALDIRTARAARNGD